jgi:hypothetical protein
MTRERTIANSTSGDFAGSPFPVLSSWHARTIVRPRFRARWLQIGPAAQEQMERYPAQHSSWPRGRNSDMDVAPRSHRSKKCCVTVPPIGTHQKPSSTALSRAAKEDGPDRQRSPFVFLPRSGQHICGEFRTAEGEIRGRPRGRPGARPAHANGEVASRRHRWIRKHGCDMTLRLDGARASPTCPQPQQLRAA